MKSLKIELSLNETNLILEALGNMPYIKVHSLISRIQQQGNQQLALSGENINENEMDDSEVIESRVS